MTLTETVFWTKIMSRYLVVGLVLIIGGWFVWNYIIFKPDDKVLSPNYKCGSIEAPALVAQEGVDANSAVIEVKALRTALPDSEVPPISYVFQIDIRGETFETRDKAKLLARNFDFDEEIYTHESGSTKYEWNNLATKSTLIYDTATSNFSFFKDATKLPEAPNLQLPATMFKTPEYAINYLTALGVYNSEFQNGETFMYPVAMRGSDPYTVQSLDQAQLLRIDFQKVTPVLFYPTAILSPIYEGPRTLDYTQFVQTLAEASTKDKERYTQYYARRVGQTPWTSNVQLYMNSQQATPSLGIYKLDFNNWKVDETPCGTYPLKKPSEAISGIAQGQGTIVSLIPKGGDILNPISEDTVTSISLYDMELVYYEANEVREYLQPIYVALGEATFEGGYTGDIAIYIPAINYEAFQTNSSN